MFLGFVVLIGVFHYRCVKTHLLTHKTKTIIYILYISSLLILIRNIFRTAAVFYPYDSVANGSEAVFYVLEALPMVVNTFLMNVWPPAKYLPANQKIYLAVDGKTEVEGPGMVDKRGFLASLLDPFDVVGIVTKRDQKNRFWERDGIGGPKPEAELETVHGNEVTSVERNSLKDV